MTTSMHLSQIQRWIFSSPPIEIATSKLKELLINALRQGPIPEHIAFVMDGNRRFAKSHGIETVEGHNLGFESLARILEVCYKSGVKVVSIYAFSIENFKRSKFEVDTLMEMAKMKLAQFAQHGDLLQYYGARIRVLGRLDLLRPDVLAAVNRAVEMTSGNGDRTLNICFPYTSRDEITTSIRDTVAEYSTPVKPAAEKSSSTRTRFSESHIALNIRAQSLNSNSNNASASTPETTKENNNTESTEAAEAALDSPVAEGDSEPNQNSNDDHHDHDHLNHNVTKQPHALSETPHLVNKQQHEQPQQEAQHKEQPQPKASSKKDKPLNTTNKNKTKNKTKTNHANTNTTPETPIFISPETITPKTLTDHMLTKDSPPLDLLIRTSGVERLSDFMLWQCHENTEIVFLDVMWPEFSLWYFLPVLLGWQRRVLKSRQDPDAEGDFNGPGGGDGDDLLDGSAVFSGGVGKVKGS